MRKVKCHQSKRGLALLQLAWDCNEFELVAEVNGKLVGFEIFTEENSLGESIHCFEGTEEQVALLQKFFPEFE